MSMMIFRVAIMFRCVWWCSEMRNSMREKKTIKSSKITTIISIDGNKFLFEMILYQQFEFGEGIKNIGLVLQRIEPNIFSEKIYKNYIIFKTIYKKYYRILGIIH